MKNNIEKYVTEGCECCNGIGRIKRLNPLWMRLMRECSGISLREVAKKLKLSAPYISDVELGKRAGNSDIWNYYESLKVKG